MIKDKVKNLLSHIEELQKEEDAEYGSHNLEEYEGNLTAEQIEKVVEEINQKISKWGKIKAWPLLMLKSSRKKFQNLRSTKSRKTCWEAVIVVRRPTKMLPSLK